MLVQGPKPTSLLAAVAEVGLHCPALLSVKAGKMQFPNNRKCRPKNVQP